MEVAGVLCGDEFMSLVRGTGLIYNPTVLPYQSSDIALQSLEIETLSPLAKYVLKDNLTHVEQLREALLPQRVDIFQLPGRVEVISGPERTFVAPPVIEEWPHEGRLIVDGLHRIWLARQYGLKRVTCVFIRNISIPLVPLPVQWDEVQEYPPGHVPAEKRAYRFDKFSDVAAVERAMEWGVSEENFRYFFFREFAQLGSSGIRQFSSGEEQEEGI